MPFDTARPPVSGRLLLLGAAALAALAVGNLAAARLAERRHPPRGRFIEVDGVRLHYTDRGSGPPVLLVHGNVVSGDDYDASGIAELLLPIHRIIIFDRPGFGHSERPRGRRWTAAQQAELLHRAARRIGVERPVVVGHSWGAIVALAMAERHPADVAGLVLLSGYYFWSQRPDVATVAPAALPGLGDILRYTVSPLLGRLFTPPLKRAMFSPQPVPAPFQAAYSEAMALRPSQIRATAVDGALMIPGALGLRRRYSGLAMPVVIIAGRDDKVVSHRAAERLHDCIRGSVLHIVAGAGHMVHYAVPRQVAAAIRQVGDTGRAGEDAMPPPAERVAA